MLNSFTNSMGTLAIIFIFFSIITNYYIQGKNLHFSKWIKTCTGDNLTIYCFKNILTKGVDNCVETCKANKECKYINYKMRSKTCSLIGMVNNSIFQDFKQECSVEPMKGYIFGNKSEWNMNKYEICKECKHQGACETTKMNTLCQLSGCGPPAKKTFTGVYGNMFGIGDKVEYECIDGYNMKMSNHHNEHGDHGNTHVPAACQENGTWSYTDFECEHNCVLANVARGKTVTLSSQFGGISPGELMVDGNKGQIWPCACSIKEPNPWALTDLGQSYSITNITILNRLDCCPERLHDLAVHIGDDPTSLVVVARHKEPVYASHTFIFDESVRGRYVKLQIEANEFLTICELEVFACS